MARKKSDPAHEATDKEILKIEREIAKEYRQAHKEVTEKLNDYLARFVAKDEIWRKRVENGEIPEQEYIDWRRGQMLIGKRWEGMCETLAQDYANAAKIAQSITKGYAPEVYAINHNYATFDIEKKTGLDTSYTLYSRETIERMYRENPKIYHDYGKAVAKDIKEGKQVAWDKKRVRSVLTQAVLQGESIPKITKRLEIVTGGDHNAAIRNARTMMTGVQNAGRIDAMNRAQDKGIPVRKQWLATVDGRTRHWHRELDGAVEDLDKPFENSIGKIMFPADPDADGANVYNCRCTLLSAIKGFELDVTDPSIRPMPKLKDMTYEEWKTAKAPKEAPTENVASQATNSKITRNYNNHIAKSVGKDRYDGICDALDAAKDTDAKALYMKHIDDVGVLNSKSKGGAYCQFTSINWNAEKDSVDSTLRKAHSVFYHESGHAIDHLLAKEKGMGWFYSTTWNNGEFSTTIKDEVKGWVEGIKKELKDGLKAHASDIEWLKSKKLLSDWDLQRLEWHANKNGVSVEDILSKKVKIPDAKYNMPKVVNQSAYNLIEKEFEDMMATDKGNWKMSDISDILEGATKGGIQCGWGHGKSYWKSTDVAVEAFAEMMQAHVVGGESLKVLEKYLPKSVDAFRRMCKDAVK